MNTTEMKKRLTADLESVDTCRTQRSERVGLSAGCCSSGSGTGPFGLLAPSQPSLSNLNGALEHEKGLDKPFY